MSLTSALCDGVTYARLTGELTVFTVADLQDDIFGLLNHARVTLDLSELTDLDGCGAQLLAILQMQALRAGKSITLIENNPQVDNVLRLMGIAALFQMDTELSRGPE